MSYTPLKGTTPKSMDSKRKFSLVFSQSYISSQLLHKQQNSFQSDTSPTGFYENKFQGWKTLEEFNRRNVPNGLWCARILTTDFSVKVKEIPFKQINLRSSILGCPLQDIFNSPSFSKLLKSLPLKKGARNKTIRKAVLKSEVWSHETACYCSNVGVLQFCSLGLFLNQKKMWKRGKLFCTTCPILCSRFVTIPAAATF